MKYLATYDLMETARNANEWMGATARAVGASPAFGLVTNPAFQLMAAWGEVTERSFARMSAKPDWGIDAVTGEDGRDHVVGVRTEVARPFGDLVHFRVSGREPMRRRVLLVAPMSGHYATLLRSTVRSLLPDCEVYVTDWHNARDIPVSAGKFDVEDYTLYIADFIRHLGPDIHVVAVCQPVPLALAAAALLAEDEPEAMPATLTLIGGPVDPDAAPTEVTDFGRRVTMGQLERTIIQRVGFKFAGAGRLVYPGLLQLASFMSMNAERHGKAFTDQIFRVAKGEASDHDRHNRFYDEYLAVMDMTAEFYLSTVERIFKEREVARNVFSIGGRRLDLGKIRGLAVHIVEGEEDDISAPGQCLAALPLLTGIPEEKKSVHLEPGAGHYGIFAGGSWRRNIRPLVLRFIDENAREVAAAPVAPPPAERPAAPAPASVAQAEAIAHGAAQADHAPPARGPKARKHAEAPQRTAEGRRRGAAAPRAAAEAGGAAPSVTTAPAAKPDGASAAPLGAAPAAGDGAPAPATAEAEVSREALRPIETRLDEAEVDGAPGGARKAEPSASAAQAAKPASEATPAKDTAGKQGAASKPSGDRSSEAKGAAGGATTGGDADAPRAAGKATDAGDKAGGKGSSDPASGGRPKSGPTPV